MEEYIQSPLRNGVPHHNYLSPLTILCLCWCSLFIYHVPMMWTNFIWTISCRKSVYIYVRQCHMQAESAADTEATVTMPEYGWDPHRSVKSMMSEFFFVRENYSTISEKAFNHFLGDAFSKRIWIGRDECDQVIEQNLRYTIERNSLALKKMQSTWCGNYYRCIFAN